MPDTIRRPKIQIIMKKKKMASLFVYQALSALLTWANKNKNRGFFIVLCDKEKTHVAFQNIDKVSCEGAVTIGSDPELAGAFEMIEVGVDATSKDCSKDDPKWIETANALSFDEKTWRWIGFDFEDEQPFQYNKATAPQRK